MSVNLPGYTIPAEQLARTDPSSYSNFTYAQTTNYHIDVTPDFDAQIFKTVLDIEVVIRTAGAVIVSLDHKGQDLFACAQIDAIQGQIINDKVTYAASAETCALGDRFIIGLPQDKPSDVGDKFFYRFTYNTSPKASAAQFLPIAQTGTDYHYVYTQCQAIHARSLLFIQDTCASKATYTAEVHVAAPLVAVMGANPTSPSKLYAEPTRVNEETKTQTFTFSQPIPLPPYLYALCIGDLQQREISHRTGVIATPVDVDVAKREYADLETSLSMIESFAGPYRFTNYYVLSQPAAFPFGGMENPSVSFMSQSLLPLPRQKFFNAQCQRCQGGTDAEEEALGIASSVAIHEQCHSWAGNLSTNQDWQHFYLNEGLCVTLEWKTIEKLHGKAIASLHRLIGWEELKHSVALYEEMGCPEATCLVTDLSGDIDPDDYFSSVPYMKGSAFMFYLEEIMGGCERFEAFLRQFFDHFAYKTLNSDDFKAFYLAHCKANGFEERLGEIDWNTWLYKPGLAPVQPAVDMTLANQAYELAHNVTDVTQPTISSDLNLAAWKSTQQTVFLDKLHTTFDDAFELVKANVDEKAKLQAFYRDVVMPAVVKLTNFGASANSELFSRWLHLHIKAASPHDTILADGKITLAESIRFLLVSVGRMKFVRPTIRVMLRSSLYRQYCLDVYQECRESYHIICSTMADKDVAGVDSQPLLY